jgi:hypothetical protein
LGQPVPKEFRRFVQPGVALLLNHLRSRRDRGWRSSGALRRRNSSSQGLRQLLFRLEGSGSADDSTSAGVRWRDR